MRVIENLLHLCRRQCEGRRRYLAELDLLAQRLRADAGRLRAEIERADDPALALSLPERLDKLERSVAAIDGQIVAARDALAAAEGELQRHELATIRRAGRPRPASSAIAGPGGGG